MPFWARMYLSLSSRSALAGMLGSAIFSLLMLTPPPWVSLRISPLLGKTAATSVNSEIIGWLDKALSTVDTATDEVDTYDAVKSWALPKISSELGLGDDFVRKFLDEFEDLYKALPRQVIHRDPNPSNIIVADDKWGFIDFELSERNVRIFDPCYAATAILSETFEDGNSDKFMKWISVMKEMIAGYDSVIRLTEEEKQAVPYIILANQFISTAYFADKDRYQELYETNRKMTRCIIYNIEKMRIE